MLRPCLLLLFALLVASVGLSFPTAGCSSVQHCTEGQYAATNVDPNGSPCVQQCDCSNLEYEGYCIRDKNGERRCISIQREECTSPNRSGLCVIQKDFRAHLGCEQGERSCKDKNLDDLYWGNCNCPTNPQETTAEPRPADADAGPTDKMAPDAGPEPPPEKGPEPSPEPAPADTGPPPRVKIGSTTILTLKELTQPPSLKTIIEQGERTPILLYTHHSDAGQKGSLTFTGAMGTTPPVTYSANPPLSTEFRGGFDNNAFTVGPSHFYFIFSGNILPVNSFTIKGTIASSTTFSDVSFSGFLKASDVEAQIKFNPCNVTTCDTGSDGTQRLRVEGTFNSVPHTTGYAAIITSPHYLETEIPLTQDVVIFFTEVTDSDKIVIKLASCTGSQKENKPCSGVDGATMNSVTAKGTLNLDKTKRKATYTLPSNPGDISPNTWYRLDVTSTGASGTHKAYTIFKTKQ